MIIPLRVALLKFYCAYWYIYIIQRETEKEELEMMMMQLDLTFFLLLIGRISMTISIHDRNEWKCVHAAIKAAMELYERRDLVLKVYMFPPVFECGNIFTWLPIYTSHFMGLFPTVQISQYETSYKKKKKKKKKSLNAKDVSNLVWLMWKIKVQFYGRL